MFLWPDLGTRVTVRYRRAEGSVPPLTDAVGHLLTVDPVVRVQTKTGAVVEFAPADVVALRVLTDAPVRTSQIRALEHAAAAAWPGAQRTHLDGWLLRAGHGAGLVSNSAVPLDISANLKTIPAIVAWYERRGLPPLLAIPDRLLKLPQELTDEPAERILVRDLSDLTPVDPDPSITLAARPDGLTPLADALSVLKSHGVKAKAFAIDGPVVSVTVPYDALGQMDRITQALEAGGAFSEVRPLANSADRTIKIDMILKGGMAAAPISPGG